MALAQIHRVKHKKQHREPSTKGETVSVRSFTLLQGEPENIASLAKFLKEIATDEIQISN